MGFSQQNFGLLPLKSILPCIMPSHTKKSKEQIGEEAAAARFSPLFWYGSRLVVRSREDYSAALLKHRHSTHIIHMLKSDLEKICIYVIKQHWYHLCLLHKSRKQTKTEKMVVAVMKLSLIFLMILHFTLGIIIIPDYIITRIGNFCSKHNQQSVTLLTPKNLSGLKKSKKV